MFNIIGAILTGLFIGALARFFYPGSVDLGWIATILLGIGGSVLASLIASRGHYGPGIHKPGCIASILGAMALILIGRILGWG